MCRLQKRKKNGEKWSGRLVQNVVLKLNLVAQESGQCHILIAGNDEYQIKEKNVHYIVNLERRMCNCGVWELSGIPCKHAAVAIYHKRQLLEEYVDDVYSSENYLKAYCHIIHPIPHHEFWPENLQVSSTNLAPLLYKRKPGRPKKSRNREAGEGGASKRSNSVKCKRCGGWGRNIRTCKGIQAISSTSNPSVQASSNNLVEVNVESSCTQKISATINNVVPRPKPSVAPRSKPRSASLEPPNPSTLTPANPKTTPINVVPNGKRVSTTTSISKFKPPAKVRATSKSYASSNSSARSVGDNEKISVREDDPQQ